MKISNQTTATAAGVLLFSATALIGWRMQRQPVNETDREIPARDFRGSRRSERTSQETSEQASAKRMLRAIEAETSPEERMRATVALVNTLSPDELLTWLDKRLFTSRDGFELTLFSKLAVERLSHEEPLKLLAWSMKNQTSDGEASLKILAKSDPQALLDFFKENPDTNVELRALASISETNPELALARVIELSSSVPAQDRYQFGAAMVAMAKSSPEQLEAALGSLKGNARQVAEAALIGEKLNQSFGTEIQKLVDRPDGLTLLRSAWQYAGSTMADTMLANLGSLPASWQSELANNANRLISSKNALQWLNADLEGAGMTSQQANSIRTQSIQLLAYTNPEQALQGYLALDRSSMDESSRMSALRSLFSNQPDLDAASGLIARLDNEADRETANEILQSNNATSQDNFRGVATSQEWIKKAEALFSNPKSIDPYSNDQYALTQAIQTLNKGQLTQLGKDLNNLPPETQRNIAGILTNDSWEGIGIEPNLKGQAIGYLISNPPDVPANTSDPFGGNNDSSILASTHAVKWAQTDPAAASAWTSKLPDGEAKSWASKNLAATWMQYDPAAAKKWISNLPVATRSEVEQFLISPSP